MESVLLCAGLVDIQLTQADGHGDCLSIPLCSCAPSTHLIKLPVNGSKRVHKQTCGLGRAMKNLTAPKRRSVRAGLFKGSSRPRTSISWLKEDFLTGACVPWMHPQPVGHDCPHQGGRQLFSDSRTTFRGTQQRHGSPLCFRPCYSCAISCKSGPTLIWATEVTV